MDTRASISQLRALLSGPSGFLPWRLYTNAGYLGLGTAAFALLGLAFWNVVARLHTPEVVGLAGTAITSLFLLAQVSHLGLGYALIHAIPRSGSQSVPQIGRSLVAVTAGSLLLGLVFLGTLPMWSQELKTLPWQSPGYAVGYLAFAVFVSVLGVLRFAVIAYRRSEFVLALNLTEGTVRIPLAVALGSLGRHSG